MDSAVLGLFLFSNSFLSVRFMKIMSCWLASDVIVRSGKMAARVVRQFCMESMHLMTMVLFASTVALSANICGNRSAIRLAICWCWSAPSGESSPYLSCASASIMSSFWSTSFPSGVSRLRESAVFSVLMGIS